jgi:ring-1,2-phenylacetyl-CoA epoxidase subunit PaaE
MQFYALTIRDIRHETPDCVSVAFEVPDHLTATFEYHAGQYLTLRTTLDGEEVRRSYSICTAPHERDLRVAIKRVEGGQFSTWANQTLRIGDTLDVMPPQGRFGTLKLPDHAANAPLYVAFAAGSGITPILSIISATLHDDPNSRFVLFYGNRGFDHIIFREALEALKNHYPARLSIHHILSRESLGNDLQQGRLDGERCARLSKAFFQPTAITAYYLCGPEEMIFGVKAALEDMEVPAEWIKFELFTTANSRKKAAAQANMPKTETPAFEAAIQVIQDGAVFDFNLQNTGSTLLDAAMRAGADLPFSCKGGVCSTCKAKILEGEVTMEVNYGLEPDEVAAGYVLTCQAHPKSNRVVVSFDE